MTRAKLAQRLNFLLIASSLITFACGFRNIYLSPRLSNANCIGHFCNDFSKSERSTPLTKPILAASTTSTTKKEPIASIEKSNIESLKTDVDGENDLYDWAKQWYPVLPMEYVKDLDLDKSPLGITILDQDLVIWKAASTGEYSIFKDKCPHRNTQLSTGKIINDTLACRYHGWEFNKDGSCAKIPMMPKENKENKLMSKAFCVDSYSIQIRGGLLWVYMDPTETNPPNIPSEIFQNLGDDEQGWMMNVNPMSYHSMIENSFDPSHAPFTHEGPGFGFYYSPSNAIPMQYELVTNITKSGFTLKHSPYQSFPGAPPPKVDSTRTFISPVTSISSSPFLNATLFFVPTKPGEVITLAKFLTGTTSKKKKIKLPKKLSAILSDFMHFYIIMSDGVNRFMLQDRTIMQAQDRLKTISNKWEDRYPTQSDVGVRSMQTWSRRVGRPAFTMPSSLYQHRPMSIWDNHAKFCPICKRCIKRLSNISKKGDLVSKVTLGTSLLGIFMPLILKKWSNVFIKASLMSLILSVATKYLSISCNNVMERVFVNPNQSQRYAMMEIYQK